MLSIFTWINFLDNYSLSFEKLGFTHVVIYMHLVDINILYSK